MKELAIGTILPLLSLILPLVFSAVLVFWRAFNDGSMQPPKDVEEAAGLWWAKLVCSFAMLGISLFDICLTLTSSDHQVQLVRKILDARLKLMNSVFAVSIGVISMLIDYKTDNFPDVKNSIEAVSSLAIAYTCFKYYMSIQEFVARMRQHLSQQAAMPVRTSNMMQTA